ncbi:hypothetical protein FQA39_LY03415 [Lamprigera yunnana]|nr:hypothetical protein FQA39_LY03415 [Lamprigera yunnana]
MNKNTEKSKNLIAEEVSSLDDYDYEDSSNESDNNCSNNCKLVTEKEIVQKGNYVLHIAATPEESCNIAVGTSKKTCEIYRLGENQLAKLESFGEFESPIVGVQFSPEDTNLIYCGVENGNVKLWDLRNPDNYVLQFSENKPDDVKRFASFDVASNNRLLCASTELHKGDAFILFWDIRNVNLMGGYWESHSDTITQVKFDPNNVNKLISGSLDGLINLYDLKYTSEDESLMDCFNTESPIDYLQWFDRKGKDCISCFTSLGNVQLWSTDDVEPYANFHRAEIAKAMNLKSEAHCYIISAHKQKGEELLVLAGSKYRNGEYVKCLYTNNKKLESLCSLNGNNQLIRSSMYNPYYFILAEQLKNTCKNCVYCIV